MTYASESELKTYLGISGADDATAGIVAGVQAFIEAYTGRRWVARWNYDADEPFIVDNVESDPFGAADTTVLVTNADAVNGDGAPRFVVGQRIEIGDEVLVIEDIAGLDDQLTVRRGVAGTTAAAHIQGTDIYAYGPVADRERVFLAQPPHVVQGGRRLIFHEDVAAGTLAAVVVEGVDVLQDCIVLRGPSGDAFGLALSPFGAVRRFTSYSSYIRVDGGWYSTHGAADIKQISLELGQYLYFAGKSGSGGVSQIASRQTGLVVQQDMVPERILQRLTMYRRMP